MPDPFVTFLLSESRRSREGFAVECRHTEMNKNDYLAQYLQSN